MAREYRERVTLRTDVDLDAVERITAFVNEKTSAECHLVEIGLTDGRIVEPTLGEARSRLSPGDQVVQVDIALFKTVPDRLNVVIQWRRSGASWIDVSGPDETGVLGLAAALRRYLGRRRFLPESERGPVGKRWLRRWLTGVSVQVAGLVVGTALLALVAAVWAVLT